MQTSVLRLTKSLKRALPAGNVLSASLNTSRGKAIRSRLIRKNPFDLAARRVQTALLISMIIISPLKKRSGVSEKAKFAVRR